jgi:hypothetical protein
VSYFAKIAEHKCVEDPQSEMFKHGPFLNFQFSIMAVIYDGRQQWAVPTLPTLIKVLVGYENLLKPFQIGIVSFPTTLPYVPGLGSQEEKNFWFYAKTSEE